MEEPVKLDVSFPLHLPARRRCPQCGTGVMGLRARETDWVYVCCACSTMERAPTPAEAGWMRTEPERPPIFEAAEVPKQERADTQHVGPLTER